MRNKNALIVFTKAPVAGATKTRLIPALGAEGAAELHRQLVLHTLRNLINVDCWDTLLWCAGDIQHDFLQQCALDYNLRLFSQQGDDLGQRMHHAMNASLQFYESVCIIGTDCPVLSKKNIAEAFHQLNDVDLVFNPVEDGGYVLLAAKFIDQQVFENIQWSTDEVMSKTLNNTKQLGLQVKLLARLWDIDLPEDLERLKADNSVKFKLPAIDS